MYVYKSGCISDCMREGVDLCVCVHTYVSKYTGECATRKPSMYLHDTSCNNLGLGLKLRFRVAVVVRVG